MSRGRSTGGRGRVNPPPQTTRWGRTLPSARPLPPLHCCPLAATFQKRKRTSLPDQMSSVPPKPGTNCSH
ncbi:unnamed protein product [Timema podura]|uniref:Uncharacterized protein n=1 Tax=Timema podura TaxID=61482 RepID=A0ABN7NSZ2_TIMPD|nr:unnamed protein product [Timema podura]